MIHMRGFVQGQNLRVSLTGVYKCNGSGKGLVNATKWESYSQSEWVNIKNVLYMRQNIWRWIRFLKVYCNN